MPNQRILGRRAPVPSVHVKSREGGELISAVLDARADSAANILARHRKVNRSRLLRALVVEEFARVFGRAFIGPTFDRPRQWSDPVRRAYQDAYAQAYRRVRRTEGGAIDEAREAGRRAGAKAARAKAREKARDGGADERRHDTGAPGTSASRVGAEPHSEKPHRGSATRSIKEHRARDFEAGAVALDPQHDPRSPAKRVRVATTKADEATSRGGHRGR